MFTWKLPARAGTLKGYGSEVDLGLVGFAATALAFAPKGQFVYPF